MRVKWCIFVVWWSLLIHNICIYEYVHLDVTKAISNYFKHGVSFEYATMVFGDDHALEIEDVKHSQRNIGELGLEKLR